MLNSEDQRILESMLSIAHKEIERLQAELAQGAGLHTRIADLYNALDRANERTERVLAMKADPPIFTMAPSPLGDVYINRQRYEPRTGIVFDEVSTFRDIYFKDFFKSFWRRLRRRWEPRDPHD